MDIIALAIALIAAGMSFVNTWHAINRDRVRLRVRSQFFVSNGKGVNFEVTNLGVLPVTLSRIGISLPRKEYMAFLSPRTDDGLELPLRMEPRTSVTLLIPLGAYEHPRLGEGINVLVETACGRTFQGSNRRAFRSHIKHLCATR